MGASKLPKPLRWLEPALDMVKESFPQTCSGELLQQLPEALNLSVPQRETLMLRTFGLLQVPVLFFIGPSVTELTHERCVIKVPLNRRTRNHLKSMYFGVLAAGADAAAGLMAMNQIRAQKASVQLIFKDFHADFLKRAEGDVYFHCEAGAAIRDLVDQTVVSGERQSLPVKVVARVPSRFGDEPVAVFTLTLSLKNKKKK